MPSSVLDNEFASEMQQYVEIHKSALDNAIEWIAKELDPEDVFSEKQLSKWAEDNGFIKEE